VAYSLDVRLSGAAEGVVTRQAELPKGCQPLLTPDDCDLAEKITKADPKVAKLLKDRYGITDLSLVAADPWSVHIAASDFPPLDWRSDGIPARLVQTFLYLRDDPDDNHYAHPVSHIPPPSFNGIKQITWLPVYLSPRTTTIVSLRSCRPRALTRFPNVFLFALSSSTRGFSNRLIFEITHASLTTTYLRRIN
jgi:hypothetical protein